MRLSVIIFLVLAITKSDYAGNRFISSLKLEHAKPDYFCCDSILTPAGVTRIYCIPAGTSRMFLLASDRGMVLIDAGWPGFEWRVKQLMNSLHRNDLRLIVITHGHFDHYGSAAAIRRITNAPIAIQELDDQSVAQGTTELGLRHGLGHIAALFLPLSELLLQMEGTFADIIFDDNFSLKPYGIDASVIHTPGHTPGSSTVLLCDSIAFSGDLLTSFGSKIRSQHYCAHDWYQLAHSLILLKSKAPVRTYPAHGNHFITSRELFDLRPLIVE